MEEKYKNINLYGDKWTVMKAKLEGDEFYIRVRSSFDDAVGHPNYPYQVGIAIPLNWQTESGIVSSVEIEPLNKIEDKISQQIESDNTKMIGVLTGRNMREFILYTSNPEEVEIKILKLKKQIDSHEIQYVIKSDPDWETYKFIRNK